MSNDVLKVSKREIIGTNGVKKLRRQHWIPGVLYGHHIDNVNIQVEEHDFTRFFKMHGPGATLDLEIAGEKTFVLFKEVKLNFLKNETTHIEFQALSKGEKIKVKVPIHFIGKEKIPAGLVGQEHYHEIEMQVLPKDLIEFITLDVSKLELGQHIAISDLDVSQNKAFEIFDDLDTFVFSISGPNAAEPDPEEGAEEIREVPEIGKEEE